MHLDLWKGKRGIHRAVLAVREIRGMCVVRDSVPIGTEYLIDLTTREPLRVAVEGAGEYVEECAWAVNVATGYQGYIPLCLLEVDEGCVEDASGATARTA